MKIITVVFILLLSYPALANGIVSKSSDKTSEEIQEYWTEERMRKAKPIPVPTVDKFNSPPTYVEAQPPSMGVPGYIGGSPPVYSHIESITYLRCNQVNGDNIWDFALDFDSSEVLEPSETNFLKLSETHFILARKSIPNKDVVVVYDFSRIDGTMKSFVASPHDPTNPKTLATEYSCEKVKRKF